MLVFDIVFDVSGRIQQEITIQNPIYTKEYVMHGIRNGTILVSLSDNKDVIDIKDGKFSVIGKITATLPLDNTVFENFEEITVCENCQSEHALSDDCNLLPKYGYVGE